MLALPIHRRTTRSAALQRAQRVLLGRDAGRLETGAVAGLFAAGIGVQTAIQIDLDDDFRGRVMSLYFMVAIGSAAFGAAVIGWLSDLVGFQATLTAFGVTALVGLGLLALRGR